MLLCNHRKEQTQAGEALTVFPEQLLSSEKDDQGAMK